MAETRGIPYICLVLMHHLLAQLTAGTVAVKAADGSEPRVTRKYSADVGAVLATVKGPKAEYVLKGDELYVRARVTSTKPMRSSPIGGEVEMAWTQPLGR